MSRKYGRLILLVLAAGAVIYGIYWGIAKLMSDETSVYQVLVAVYDEKNANPVKDKKNSMKKGYVIGVYPEDHQWSQTEKFSYLILKMKLNEKEKAKLTEPVQKEVERKTLGEDQEKKMDTGKNPEVQKETVAMREYKIDLEKIGFNDPNVLLNGQPFPDKLFGWEIVAKIEN